MRVVSNVRGRCGYRALIIPIRAKSIHGPLPGGLASLEQLARGRLPFCRGRLSVGKPPPEIFAFSFLTLRGDHTARQGERLKQDCKTGCNRRPPANSLCRSKAAARRMGRAQRNPSKHCLCVMGFARAQPILVWGCGSQEAIIAAISFNNGAYQFLGSAEGVSSSRPRFCEAPRAAVVKAGRHCGGAAGCVVSRPRLGDGEPGAKLDGRDDRS